MSLARGDFEEPVVDLEDQPVRLVNADAPPAGPVPLQWFGLADA